MKHTDDILFNKIKQYKNIQNKTLMQKMTSVYALYLEYQYPRVKSIKANFFVKLQQN